jgi:hypothetical protein
MLFEEMQQQQASAEAAITNTGQRTQLRCRVLAAKERAQSCLVSRNTTQM